MDELEAEEPPQPKGSNSKLNKIIEKLHIDSKELEKIKRKYPIRSTTYYLSLIEEKDDPIYKQCIPSKEELISSKTAKEDPLEEESHLVAKYLVHKYKDRALLMCSNQCAMYCRHCTRKRKVGKVEQFPLNDVLNSIEYIKDHPEIRDVVVSGGDPLMRTNKDVEAILSALKQVPHIEIIRIGTRMPCVSPSRITKKLVNILKKYSPLYMNIQFNHPKELTPEVKKAVDLLADNGIVLGCQTVLLKGVNDNLETMKELMQKLLTFRIKPYYVYQCDPIKGVDHFICDIEEGKKMMEELQKTTSGLCCPRFILDTSERKISLF